MKTNTTRSNTRLRLVAGTVFVGMAALALGACAPSDQDIKHELDDLTANVKGKIPPLPVFKPYTATNYSVESLADPFGPAKAVLAGKHDGKSDLASPDTKRQRQPLEAFPLEAMELNGTIIQHGTVHAMVASQDSLYTVRIGDYMGQNFGRVIKITESEVILMEKIQEPSGDWVERENRLSLSGSGK